MSDEEDLLPYSSSSDTEPTLDWEFRDGGKSPARNLTNQDLASMLDLDASMSETDAESRDRPSSCRSAKNRRGSRARSSQSSPSSLAWTENSSPLSMRANSRTPPANNQFHRGSTSSSSQSSPTSPPDILLAGNRTGNTPPSVSCRHETSNHRQCTENELNSQTTPIRSSHQILSCLRRSSGGHSSSDSISERSHESTPRRTPTMRTERYRSAIGEVVDDHNHPNDENDENVSHTDNTEKNTSSSSELLLNAEHSKNPASVISPTESQSVCKALQEITGLINSVSKKMADIEGKLDERTIPKTKGTKEKIPLSIKV